MTISSSRNYSLHNSSFRPLQLLFCLTTNDSNQINCHDYNIIYSGSIVFFHEQSDNLIKKFFGFHAEFICVAVCSN